MHSTAQASELNLDEIRRRLRAVMPELRERFHVATLEIFGSYVRGEARPDSDVDVLVTFAETPNLFELVELGDFLSEVLGVKVDVVPKKWLKPRLRPYILAEAQAI